jgi:hypothetical protein
MIPAVNGKQQKYQKSSDDGCPSAMDQGLLGGVIVHDRISDARLGMSMAIIITV